MLTMKFHRVSIFACSVLTVGFMQIALVTAQAPATEGAKTGISRSADDNTQSKVLVTTFLEDQRTDDLALFRGGPPGSVTFHSQRDGNFEIYRMNPDGSDEVRLTSNTAADTNPELSPNGKYVVFVSNRVTVTNPSGDTEIFVMKADGSDVTQLTFNNAVDGWPRWSPNGRYIAFHSNVVGNFEIYVIDLEGSELVRVTDYAGIDQWPEWSPDGKQLAIRRDHDVYLINIDGTDPVRLTDNSAVDQMAAWSPNGQQLAFMSLREGYCSVFLMNSDGTDQVNLTPKDPADPNSAWCSRAPTWSRNGQQIYFMSFRPSTAGDAEIFSMNVDGTNVNRLTFSPGEDGLPTIR